MKCVNTANIETGKKSVAYYVSNGKSSTSEVSVIIIGNGKTLESLEVQVVQPLLVMIFASENC